MDGVPVLGDRDEDVVALLLELCFEVLQADLLHRCIALLANDHFGLTILRKELLLRVIRCGFLRAQKSHIGQLLRSEPLLRWKLVQLAVGSL